MTRNNVSRAAFSAIATLTFLLLSFNSQRLFANETEQKKPNVLFIFADDFAFDCVGYSGNEEIQTPNIDRLAKQSANFTRAYNMGSWSGAVCVASRTMLNTGHFVWRAKAIQSKLNEDYIPKNRMWSQRMAGAGYDTYMTGKWHVKADTSKIFKTVRNVRPGMPKQTKAGYNRPLSKDDKNWLPWDEQHGGFWEGGKHWTEIVADDATDYLDMAREADNPFFMYIAFNAPHDPRQSPKEFVDMYPLENIALPQPFYPEYPFKLGMNRIRDEKLAPFPRTHHNVKVNRQEYYAIITHLDREIGRILERLEASGQADNTYVVFTADHGLGVGHHGLMGKQNLHDHSVRVPFLISGPGIPAGKTIESPIYLQDVMPTSLEIAGAPIDEDVDFKSLLPLISGERKKSYDAVYGGYLSSQRAVTKDGFKLIVYPGLNEVLLYDLKKDPLETHDLSDDSDYKAKVDELFVELVKLQSELNDDVELNQEALKSNASFTSLFNGKDLDGWKHSGNWSVQDGVITRDGRGGSLVYNTSKIPDDFELRFEWKVASGSNSGVYYRPSQYEYQILDNTEHADGKNPRTSAASLYFCMPPSHDATKKPGQWNSGRVVCKGSVIQHWLNGQKIVDFDYNDPKFSFEVDLWKKRGGQPDARGAFLSLQDHGDPVWYRNLRMREIDSKEKILHSVVEPQLLTKEQLDAEAAKIKKILERRMKNSEKKDGK